MVIYICCCIYGSGRCQVPMPSSQVARKTEERTTSLPPNYLIWSLPVIPSWAFSITIFHLPTTTSHVLEPQAGSLCWVCITSFLLCSGQHLNLRIQTNHVFEGMQFPHATAQFVYLLLPLTYFMHFKDLQCFIVFSSSAISLKSDHIQLHNGFGRYYCVYFHVKLS